MKYFHEYSVISSIIKSARSKKIKFLLPRFSDYIHTRTRSGIISNYKTNRLALAKGV